MNTKELEESLLKLPLSILRDVAINRAKVQMELTNLILSNSNDENRIKELKDMLEKSDVNSLIKYFY